MRSNRAKIAIIAALMCMATVCIAVLLPLTLGKYISEIKGYTNFGIANFNAAILPPEVGGAAEPIIVTYSARDFQPGMLSKLLNDQLEEDTAAVTKFRVANGNDITDAAKTPLQYTIRIRTSKSLPLNYTLRATVKAAAEGGADTYIYYQTLPNPAVIQNPYSEIRYEYQFSPVPLELGGTGGAGEETPEEVPDAQDAAAPTEATFYLPQGTALEPFVFSDFELIAEWPATEELAGSEYMKEVEVVEILVSVISLNKMEEEDYQKPDFWIPADPAVGLLLLKPELTAENKLPTYSYQIDLRTFKENADGSSTFSFILHNGIGFGVTNPPLSANYKVRLSVPMALLEETEPWEFSVSRKDLEESGGSGTGNLRELLSEEPVEYHWKDEKTGDVKVFATLDEVKAAIPALKPDSSDEDREKTLRVTYAVYELDLGTDNELFYQERNSVNKYEPAISMQNFLFTANKHAATTDPIALINKLELTVEITALNPVPAGGNESGGGESGGEESGGDLTE